MRNIFASLRNLFEGIVVDSSIQNNTGNFDIVDDLYFKNLFLFISENRNESISRVKKWMGLINAAIEIHSESSKKSLIDIWNERLKSWEILLRDNPNLPPIQSSITMDGYYRRGLRLIELFERIGLQNQAVAFDCDWTTLVSSDTKSPEYTEIMNYFGSHPPLFEKAKEAADSGELENFWIEIGQ
jgi:hypothetical protein